MLRTLIPMKRFFRDNDDPSDDTPDDDQSDGNDSDDGFTRHDSNVQEDVRDEVKEPEMWDVFLHNDDYTIKPFVVEVLRVVFQKNAIEATKIMMHVHKHGRGVVGTYTWDIAQSKVSRVHSMAKKAEFPLRCSVSKAS